MRFPIEKPRLVDEAECDYLGRMERGIFSKLSGLLVATVVLAGCSTTTPEQRLAAAEQSCVSYGFAEGTTAFSQCMMQMDALAQQRADYERAQLKANLQNFSTAVQRMSPPDPVTCSTNTTYRGGYTPYDRNLYSNATTTCR